jgi:hypothetical protein
MRALWVAVVAAGGMTLGCAGMDQQMPRPAALSQAPWDQVGIPGPPWGGGEAKESFRSSPESPRLDIRYGRTLPGSEEEALAAWRDAQLARGWQLEGKPSHKRVSLQRPGERLELKLAEDGTGSFVHLLYGTRRVVLESWPADPFCPEGTRLDPDRKAPEVRTCYAVGSEMEEQGPHEAGEVERGQHERGLRVGRWTSVVTDVDEVVYDVVTEYGPQKTVRTWHRKDTGKLVLTEALQGQDEYPTRHGPSVWEGGPTIEFDQGMPDPAYAQAIWTKDSLRLELEDVLEVLDVDPGAGKLAFRHLRTHNSEAESHACTYPGVADPEGGVDLGVYDVQTGQRETWTVYALASEPSECTPEAEASRALAAAKARMTELGLDPTRKPQPQQPQVTGGGYRNPHRYTVTAGGRAVTLATEWVRDMPPIHHAEHVAMGVDPEANTAIGRWEGMTRPPLFLTVDRSMAGDAAISMVGAWEEDGAAIIGWRGDYQGCCSLWGFVPVR